MAEFWCASLPPLPVPLARRTRVFTARGRGPYLGGSRPVCGARQRAFPCPTTLCTRVHLLSARQKARRE